MSLVWWARNAQSPVGPVAPSDSLSVADHDGRKNDCTGFWTVWTACNGYQPRFHGGRCGQQEVAPKVMTAGEAVYTENCAHCHKATGQGDGGAAPALAG